MTTAMERHSKRLSKHRWSRELCLDTADGGFIQDRCEALKVSRIVRTQKRKGRYGKGVVTYAVDGVEEEFDTLEETVQCLENIGVLKCG